MSLNGDSFPPFYDTIFFYHSCIKLEIISFTKEHAELTYLLFFFCSYKFALVYLFKYNILSGYYSYVIHTHSCINRHHVRPQHNSNNNNNKWPGDLMWHSLFYFIPIISQSLSSSFYYYYKWLLNNKCCIC